MSDLLPASNKSDYRLSKGTGVVLLLLSLLINCFLLGLVVAPMLHPHGPMFLGPHGDMLEHLSRGLSPQDAEILRTAYQKQKPLFDISHEEMENAMHQMAKVLDSPKVDAQELHKAFDSISSAHSKMDGAMSQFIEAAIKDMSPEGRRILARDGLHPPGPPPDLPPGMSPGDHPMPLPEDGIRPPPD